MCLIGISQNKQTNLQASKETIDYQQQQQLRNENTYRTVLLNPGPNYKIVADDICLYIALVKEENFNFKDLNKFKQFAVEELCQNLLVTGPDLSMRQIASKRIREETDHPKELSSDDSTTTETWTSFVNSSDSGNALKSNLKQLNQLH